MDSEYQESIIKGAIIGGLVGDAIGSYYRFSEEKDIKLNSVDMFAGPGDRQSGMYSNAAALSLCSMASINEFGDINIDDMLERFHDCLIGGYLNFNDGEGCYLGPTTSQAIKNFSNGMSSDRCGLVGENGEDNEVLLRILPIALFMVNQPNDTFLRLITKVSRLTHNSIASDICCSLFSVLLKNILMNQAEKASEVLSEYYKSQNMQDHLEKLPLILSARDSALMSENIVPVFWTSWRIFANNETNYRYCVSRAVRIGGPTNVTAGVVGALNGLRNGLDEIPYNWMRTLKLTPEVMEVIQNFVMRIVNQL